MGATYSYSYSYDKIGNRVAASEAGVPWIYTTNSLNQYTSATENNVQLDFSYDLDGSMTYRPVDAASGWTQVWNGENRMVETFKGSDRLTFTYDYMGRRVEKCVYSGNTLTSKTLYVYEGFKCVEELDALSNNAIVMRHFWQPFDVGLDVILATTDASGTSCFLHDANKNVMQKTAANGTLQETYAYAPFGENVGTDRANIGFSSENYSIKIGLNYYNFRYYVSTLGKWTRMDPIGIAGGINVYSFLNNPIDSYDFLGLEKFEIDIIPSHRNIIEQLLIQKLINDFEKWYINEYNKIYDEKGNILPDAWILELTPCPPKYDNYDKNNWEASGIEFALVGPLYHPGGKYELRSKNPTKNGHGNQCVYDKCGNLILTLGTAGTADYFTPNGQFDKHQIYDVDPFNIINLLSLLGINVKEYLKKYYKVRPHIYIDEITNETMIGIY